jgi:hypothetical protein
MSSTGAEELTNFGQVVRVHHACRIHPRGSLISSERLVTFACLRIPSRQVEAELCATFGR